MTTEEGIDQFQLLEEKVDSLINLIAKLKKENDSFNEKYELQEKNVTALAEELDRLRKARDNATQRIVSLLEKIENIDM